MVTDGGHATIMGILFKSDEKSLLLECEKMKDEYDKLTRLHSVNMTFYKYHIKQLVDGMQSITLVRYDLQQQLRFVYLQKTLEKMYEKCMKNTY